MESALFEFIRPHKCRNKNCDSFASRKCSACNNCDIQCQELDYSKHSKLCQSLKQEKERYFFVGTILQEEMKRNVNFADVKLLSFDSFLSIMFSKVFLIFSDLLMEIEYNAEEGVNGSFDLDKLRRLRSESMKSVELQTSSSPASDPGRCSI